MVAQGDQVVARVAIAGPNVYWCDYASRLPVGNVHDDALGPARKLPHRHIEMRYGTILEEPEDSV